MVTMEWVWTSLAATTSLWRSLAVSLTLYKVLKYEDGCFDDDDNDDDDDDLDNDG